MRSSGKIVGRLKYAKKLKIDGLEPLVQQKTGLLLDPYFSASKIRWMLDHIPGARQRAERGELAFGTVDTWLVWKLTDGKAHITDATNASRTMLFNIHTEDWDDELLKSSENSARDPPRSVQQSARSMHIHPMPFFNADPNCGIAGDQQAALFGQACFNNRNGQNDLWHRLFHADEYGRQSFFSKNKLLTTIAYQNRRQNGVCA